MKSVLEFNRRRDSRLAAAMMAQAPEGRAAPEQFRSLESGGRFASATRTQLRMVADS